MSQSSSSEGKKRAVICCISYKGNKEEKEESVYNATFMKNLLETKYNFSDILMLRDDETNSTSKIPTKINILNAMEWLVKDCQQGDSLVFYYSDHGSQKKDMDGLETDDFDETLCPLDYDTNGMITDDVINETIIRPLRFGVKLHAIIESSHSGTVLDLPFLCKMNRLGVIDLVIYHTTNKLLFSFNILLINYFFLISLIFNKLIRLKPIKTISIRFWINGPVR
ncbi:metacaspase 2 [Zostera marina]|uniref:Metacaspase 2 n=1 Tax=Zostera marina TaxID=29655 RepID=A0A0K9NX45_ZOSMR|nr:metacaspase 2 [Zostera marina]